MSLSRRDFTRLLALSGTATLMPGLAHGMTRERWGDAGITSAPLPRTPRDPDEAFWTQVRARFLVPPDVGFFNAANLCPMSLPVLEAIERHARTYEVTPSPEVRSGLMAGRETARAELARALRVTPEEIVITRNTTEGNNLVSSGLKLGPGDEVLVSEDNHPSNLAAWRRKAERFGFAVVAVATPARHPGAAGYVDLFRRAITPRTRVLAATWVSSNSGDLLPVAALCALARERGMLSLIDGAQAFGVLDVNLADVKPDFFTGSMHKWPCGPKEKGVLFISAGALDRIAPSVVGVYGGRVGASRTFEAMGQRDDASIAAVITALEFQRTIGRDVIERRARGLAQQLIAELRRLDGIQLWTDPDPAHSSSIVIFRPGTLDPQRLGRALAERDRIVVTTRGASGANPGLRVSPHFYNTARDLERFVAALSGYLKNGV
jgi:selenocysteine lyase/cysteine desulfurase